MLAFVGAAGLATGPQFTSEGPDEDALVQHPFSWVARAAAAQSGMVEVVVNRTRSSPPRMLPWSLFGTAGRPAAPRYPGGVRPAAPRPPLSPWYAASPGFGEFFKWMVVAAMLEIGHGMKNMLAYFLVVRTLSEPGLLRYGIGRTSAGAQVLSAVRRAQMYLLMRVVP